MNATVIIYDERVTPLVTAETRGESLWLSVAEMQAATGWKLETEGLCRGDACVRVDKAWCGSGQSSSSQAWPPPSHSSPEQRSW